VNYPGTVTLGGETYRQVIVDVGASLAEHGVERLVVVNCHGGNLPPLDLAADRLTYDHDLTVHVVHWTDYARDRLEAAFGEGWGHAGDHETSVVEHYRPDLVKPERKEVQDDREGPETRSFSFFDELAEQGGLGDPTNADADVMAEIIDEATDEILSALRADIDEGW
jgi:creatinine amidohydrolase